MFSFVGHCYDQIALCKMKTMEKTLPEISFNHGNNCSQQAGPEVGGLCFKAYGLFCVFRGSKTEDTHCRVPESAG